MDRPITFCHMPNTRSTAVLALLDELGAPHTLRVLDRTKNENRQPAFLALNPLGKVPAILDGETLVTEQVAIYLHLADRFRAKGLAPALDDANRGRYLRWMAFYGSSFEPALMDRAMKRDDAPPGMSPYGTFDGVIEALRGMLAPGPWVLGERFSAADVLWGAGFGWALQFGILPKLPEFEAYAARVAGRPSFASMRAKDAELAAAQAAG